MASRTGRICCIICVLVVMALLPACESTGGSRYVSGEGEPTTKESKEAIERIRDGLFWSGATPDLIRRRRVPMPGRELPPLPEIGPSLQDIIERFNPGELRDLDRTPVLAPLKAPNITIESHDLVLQGDPDIGWEVAARFTVKAGEAALTATWPIRVTLHRDGLPPIVHDDSITLHDGVVVKRYPVEDASTIALVVAEADPVTDAKPEGEVSETNEKDNFACAPGGIDTKGPYLSVILKNVPIFGVVVLQPGWQTFASILLPDRTTSFIVEYYAFDETGVCDIQESLTSSSERSQQGPGLQVAGCSFPESLRVQFRAEEKTVSLEGRWDARSYSVRALDFAGNRSTELSFRFEVEQPSEYIVLTGSSLWDWLDDVFGF